MKSSNVVWHVPQISKEEREKRYGHKSAVIWLTGLSGSGKSTIAYSLDAELFKRGVISYVLDGDNVRHGLNGDLSFSEDARRENIRRIGEVSKLFADAGTIAITAFISPFKDDRERVRHLFDNKTFIEIFVKCPLEVCEERDPKGWYKKAEKGEIENYTGVSSPYEEPESPEITLETDKRSLKECVQKVMDYLEKKKII